MPEVSVIIPAHNAASTIGRAVASVLAQTTKDMELIVVDDASDDDTDAVAAATGRENIKIIRHASRKGASAARNSGIRAARGVYIAFLDSDDAWLPGKLDRQLALIEKGRGKTVCVYCGYSYFDAQTGVKLGEVAAEKHGRVDNCLLFENHITGGSSTVLAPKELLVRLGMFDEALEVCEDWDMWLRLAREGDFDFIPEPLCDIYIRRESLSSDLNRMLTCREIMLHKHARLYDSRPHILSLRYYVLGIQCAKLGLQGKALDYFRRAKDSGMRGPVFSWKCALQILLLSKFPKLHAGLIARFY